MVQYYTLEQAAQILRTTPDELKELARKNVVRAFQDRGSLRFRAQEIEELARSRGYGSDPGLPLADAPAKSSGRRSTAHAPLKEGGEEVPLGSDPAKSGSGSRSSSRLGKSPPPASGDSDVRLVLDGSDLDFHIDLDSSGNLKEPPAAQRPSQLKSGPADSPKPTGGRKSSRLGPSERVDSGVRMVPLDSGSDSDVRLGTEAGRRDKSGSDSDIRLQELARGGTVRKPEIVTEEIDLDAEQQQAQAKAPPRRTGAPGAGGPPVLPTSSPFELSQLDLDVDAPAGGAPDTSTSADFDLSPHRSMDSIELELGSDELDVGNLLPGGGTGSSGINLQQPVDSGPSLEEGGSDELDFSPSLDAGTTPKPSDLDDSSSDFELSLDEGSPDSSPMDDDSSSDFELSLEGAEGATTDESSSEFELTLQDDMAPAPESSSEFELTLDPEGSSSELALDEGSSDLSLESPQADSDSEFELTLDESGSLEPVQEEGAEEGGDIFETDFDVPSLDEESGSEAVALDEADTDLESSEFDLSTGDEESGSQVVPIEDEEEADEGAQTRQRPAADLEEGEEGFDELDRDLDEEAVEEEEAEEEAVAAPAAAAAPAPWGVVPALMLMPTFVILFVVALLSFELFQGMWGFHKGSKVSNLIIDPLARQLPEPIGSSSLPAD